MKNKKRGRAGKTFDNPASEAGFRRALLYRAKKLGCDIELQQLFTKYDKALSGCTNDAERKHIAAVGAAEVHRLFGCRGGLSVNGKVVIPADPGYEDDENGSKIVKI